jgi:hypothetical protein
MKPVHVGLLVLGAALAGGLALRMTQPQPFPATGTSKPAPVAAAPPAVIQPEQSPKVIIAKKPSPMPPVVSSPAPPAVFTQPERPQPERRAQPASRPAIVHQPIVTPRRREEIAQARPLDVPPLPPDPVAVPQTQPVPAPPAPTAKAIESPSLAPSPSPAPLPDLHKVTLHPGTTIRVRIDEALSSDRTVAGNTFSASLAEPLVIDGLVIAERGAPVTGRVLEAQKAGRVSGVSTLQLALISVTTADGQRVSIATDPWTRRGDSSRGEDLAKIGGGAVLGAAIGAIAGGGTGAAIGAGIGGAAGAGAAAMTRSKPAEVASETVVNFRVSYTVTIAERRI